MDREQWLAERMTGIGGSDSAAACGMSRYKSRYALWLEKTGMVPGVSETEPMRWGNLLEPIVRQEYCNRTGNVVLTPNSILRHPQYPFILGNVDGIVEGQPRGYEGKTARSADGWGDEGTNEVPDEYAIQVQHYMLVTGLPVFDVAVLIGGSDFRMYEVEADPEFQDLILEQEIEFWQLVQNGIEPQADSSEDVRRRWPASTARSLVVPENVVNWAHMLAAVRAKKAVLEDAEDRILASIQQHMADSESISTPSGEVLATWKSARGRVNFDVERFKQDHPELHKQYLRQGEGSRRFLLKVKDTSDEQRHIDDTERIEQRISGAA